MTDFLIKSLKLDRELQQATVHSEVKEMVQIDQIIRQQRVLPHAPQKLGLLPDSFEMILAAVGSKKKKQLQAINNLLNNFRQYLSREYGLWSLPNLQTVQLLKEKLRVHSALEIMAGNAYWSKALTEVGVKTISTDSLTWAKTSLTGARPFQQVINLAAVPAIKKYRSVNLILCAWSPNFGQSDLAVIQAWHQFNPDSHLIFIGEKDGATNSPEFWQQARFKKTVALQEINQSFPSFDFINERIFEIDHEI